MISVRFNGWTGSRRNRSVSAAELARHRGRWTIRAQIWGVDRAGEPLRFQATLRSPRAMRFAELAATINGLLSEVAQDMRDELGEETKHYEHAAAGWIAVSETPARKARKRR